MQPQHFKETQRPLIVIAPTNALGTVDMASLLVKPDLPSPPRSAQSEHHPPFLFPLPPPAAAAAAPLLHPACPPAAQTECLPFSELQRVTIRNAGGGEKISCTVTRKKARREGVSVRGRRPALKCCSPKVESVFFPPLPAESHAAQFGPARLSLHQRQGGGEKKKKQTVRST